MGDINVDIFLETLDNLLRASDNGIIKYNKNQFQTLAEEIQYLREFLKKTEKKRNDHPEVMELVTRIRGVVLETEDIVERWEARVSMADHYFLELQDHLFHQLKNARKGIKTLMAEVEHILNKNVYDIDGVDQDKKLELSSTGPGGGSSSSGATNTYKVEEESVVVGFKDEVMTLMGKLHDSGVGGNLEIISIIGVGGGGKTTLAREAYVHPLTLQKFEIRAWVNVSQDYNMTMKRNLLLSILKSIFPESEHEKYGNMSANELGETLLKCLRGKKYLIVMDDIWDLAAWDDIQRSFPRKHIGSKVLFTSRQPVQPHNIQYYIPHHLDLLSESCSWELLQKKVFKKEECLPELVDTGMHIARKCKGLPLAIVAIAGLLAKENKTLDVWKEVAKNLSSVIAKKQEGIMEILELSYNQLPLHLKACFLYIGAHPEDFEIPVHDLMWLWMAEGFIHQSGRKNLEAIANDYLNDLIERNLIMVAQKDWIGTIMTCSIHDLLRELCLKKGKEDKFFVQNYGDDSFSPSGTDKHRRLFIGPHSPDKYNTSSCGLSLRSIICPTFRDTWSKEIKFSFQDFELLRVFHGKFFVLGGDTMGGDLLHLRYLALRVTSEDDMDIIGYYSALEVLNLDYIPDFIRLPDNIFKMVSLRHVYSETGRFRCPSFDEEDEGNMLYRLSTLHTLFYTEDCPQFLKRTPYLRKLGIVYRNILTYVDFYYGLEFLKFLQILHLDGGFAKAMKFNTFEVKLPPSITQLTLRFMYLSWEKLEIILQTLPNLEVLTLHYGAVTGTIWDTSELEEELSQLKYLKLSNLDIEEWRASEVLFPKLEILDIEYCEHLQGIPIEFADLWELREIRLLGCPESVEESALKIQEEQKNKRGDDGCQIIKLSQHYSSNIDDTSSDEDY